MAALGAALLVAVLAVSDFRHNFLTGSGVAGGALIAAIALGVVLTYRGSGVVNLSNGAVAMYVGYVYAVLRRDGDLMLPPLPNPLSIVEGLVHLTQSPDTFKVPHIPTSISFGSSMSFWPAVVISLLFCVLLGLVLHLLVFRPLRNAPPLAKVVASVGVFVFLQAVVVRRYGITPRAVRPLPFVKKTQVDLGLFKLSQEELFVAVLVIVFTFLLWLLFQRTRFGLATCAAAENEKGAVVLGFSPDFLAGTNWVLSTVITGLLGIFVASIQSQINLRCCPRSSCPPSPPCSSGTSRRSGSRRSRRSCSACRCHSSPISACPAPTTGSPRLTRCRASTGCCPSSASCSCFTSLATRCRSAAQSRSESSRSRRRPRSGRCVTQGRCSRWQPRSPRC